MNDFHIHEITPAETALRDLVLGHETLEAANRTLCEMTGIASFLSPAQADQVRSFRALSSAAAAPRSIREWGDFQTPPTLAAQVCRFLQHQGIEPQVVVEPTYGLGNFLSAAMEHFPHTRLFYGVEIQACYEWHFKMTLLHQALAGTLHPRPVELHHDSIFSHQFSPSVMKSEVLILGNPPWVTSAELGALESSNLPSKINSDGLSGLGALTGKSNFDLNESILLRLMAAFGSRPGTLAMLCKNSVIKNWVERLPRLSYGVHDIQALEIDATKEFGASVSASLLFARFGSEKRTFSCAVTRLETPLTTLRRFGWSGDKFVSHVDKYEHLRDLDGLCPFVWRQGLKHDCASVMELSWQGERFVNGQGETLDIESEWVFPLFKSSDLKGISGVPRKWVIVPQRELGENTSVLAHLAPRLWRYLCEHRSAFDSRKSSIYKGKPAFSIFGIGSYSFAPFKVAVSGLYKTPRFTLLAPVEGKSAMVDDTCYFLPFAEPEKARLTLFLMQSAPTQGLLQSLVFNEAKRPYTKEILMRLDLNAIRNHLCAEDYVTFWRAQGEEVSPDEFAANLSPASLRQQLTLL